MPYLATEPSVHDYHKKFARYSALGSHYYEKIQVLLSTWLTSPQRKLRCY